MATALASACAGPQLDALLATYRKPGACRVPHEAPLDPPGAPSSVTLLGRLTKASIMADGGAPLSFSDDGQRLIVGHEVWSIAQRRRVWPGPDASASGAPGASAGGGAGINASATRGRSAASRP